MIALLALVFLLVAGTGAGVVMAREPRRQALALAVNGVALSLLFVVLVSLKTDRPKS
jgi:hypothetical protein